MHSVKWPLVAPVNQEELRQTPGSVQLVPEAPSWSPFPEVSGTALHSLCDFAGHFSTCSQSTLLLADPLSLCSVLIATLKFLKYGPTTIFSAVPISKDFASFVVFPFAQGQTITRYISY